MRVVSISAISYTNTKPFVWGLQNDPAIAGRIKLEFDPPALCAQKLIARQVDLGIVPVAALPQIPSLNILSDYCIGADGAVNSVFLFSKVPLAEIKTVLLDKQSRSSNDLARVLELHFWKSGMLFLRELKSGEESQAVILIGDRTFTGRDDWPFQYDLAAEWKKYTSLPFVFAVWAANRELGENFEQLLNHALKLGLDNRWRVLEELEPIPNFSLDNYLMHNISYNFDDRKKEALRLYLDLLKELHPSPANRHTIFT